jgi:single-strand selective monofunctional uracil DNA glycosylase
VDLIEIACALKRELMKLRFEPPVTHVYSPLDYAWDNYKTYLERFAARPREALLIGMNPGPWGMMQTGVPFGDAGLVRHWMGITGEVRAPPSQHPKRPVLGLGCPRGEISGQRLWGWARETYITPEAFFARFFVLNYCPLCFLERSGRNRTPDKLPRTERNALFAACDKALARSVAWLSPRHVIGVGRFAARRARLALDGIDVAMVPHPSPANPQANRDWPRQLEAALKAHGVCLG